MKKPSVKKLIQYVYDYFPFVGGYSIKDADELMKDPEHYEYRGNSWFRKLDFKRKKKS